VTAAAVVLAATSAWLLVRPPPGGVGAVGSHRRTGWWLLVVVASGVATFVVGPGALVGGGVVLAGRQLLQARDQRRAAATTADRVLEACELMSAELAAGQPPGLALGRAASSWPLLAPVAEASDLGGDVATALRRVAAEPGAGDLRGVAGAWVVAHRSGAGLAEALERVAASIRADRALRRVVESELASARATARLVAGLPLVVLLLGNGGGASAWSFLLRTPVGLLCLAGGLALGVAGLWWIERIAAAVTR
jgi:tight adherence protein B